MNSTDYRFRISVGDWSGDGHGHHEDFQAFASKPDDIVRAFAQIIVWFLTLGDPELRVTLVPSEELPTLHFYGSDKKKREIGFMGYGLFGN